MKDFIQELKWRDMIHDVTPNIEKQLKKEITSGYVGFDPTASSLHIGNLATIMLLKHFQLSGHKPYIVVGGATGMIGDPSGKSEERNLLDEKTLRYNQEKIKEQLSKFLDFDCGKNSAVLINNYEWTKNVCFLDFLRNIGKHISINYMLAKDCVQNRLEQGISFTEFSYQLLQGFDFYHLYKNQNVKIQMGGSDQWGNITTGVELVRRKTQGEVFALTSPLITKSDGTKFGKSEEGNIWLDPSRTSPYKFYQFWINTPDEEAKTLIKKFTLKNKEEIDNIISEHQNAPHQRILQKELAQEITCFVHSKEACNKAIAASRVLFGKGAVSELSTIDELTLLEIFEGVPQINISKNDYSSTENILDFLCLYSKNKIFASKSETRRMIAGGGVSINGTKISETSKVSDFSLLQSKYILVQKGKKNFYLIKIG